MNMTSSYPQLQFQPVRPEDSIVFGRRFFFSTIISRRIIFKEGRELVLSSLDNFLHDPVDRSAMTEEEKRRFEKWISKILADPSKISSMIEEALKRGMYLEWEQESVNHKFKVGSYYPSMIERCLRAQAYSYLQPLPPTHEELAIFGEGRAIHELIALALRRSGLISVEGSEVVVDLKFNGEAKLHGRIDDLLLIRMEEEEKAHDYKKGGESNDATEQQRENFKLYVPLEIKSASSLPDEPKQSHYYQLSTYLLAENYPVGVLLYWAKRGGGVRAFPITREDVMYSVLRERVFELHEALKAGLMPQKEAAANRDYSQCERCAYMEKCNPFLIDSIPRGSAISLFDIDSGILDTSKRKRAILSELGLSPSTRPMDIVDDELKEKYWELLASPRFIDLDELYEGGREKVSSQIKLGRIPIGISSSRGERLLEPTRARLANLGVPVTHLIVREPGNYDTDAKFKTKWAMRLSGNYTITECFDRDAVITSTIMKIAEQQSQKAKSEVKQ